MFNSDKFLRLLKSELKRRGYTLIGRQESDIYVIGFDGMTFDADLSEAREMFESSGGTSALEEQLACLERNFAAKRRLVSFHKAKEYLRLIPVAAELVKEDTVCVDFTGGIKKAVGYVDDAKNLIPITDGVLKEWGIPKQVVFTMADRIICSELLNTKITVSELSGGMKMAEFEPPSKELTASLMLCSIFYKRMSALLGHRFLAIAPSQTAVAAFEEVGNDIIEGIGRIIIDEYKWSDKPLSTEVILFSANEIKSVGKFSAV